jgi:hypothetical protein
MGEKFYPRISAAEDAEVTEKAKKNPFCPRIHPVRRYD